MTQSDNRADAEDPCDRRVKLPHTQSAVVADLSCGSFVALPQPQPAQSR